MLHWPWEIPLISNIPIGILNWPNGSYISSNLHLRRKNSLWYSGNYRRSRSVPRTLSDQRKIYLDNASSNNSVTSQNVSIRPGNTVTSISDNDRLVTSSGKAPCLTVEQIKEALSSVYRLYPYDPTLGQFRGCVRKYNYATRPNGMVDAGTNYASGHIPSHSRPPENTTHPTDTSAVREASMHIASSSSLRFPVFFLGSRSQLEIIATYLKLRRGVYERPDGQTSGSESPTPARRLTETKATQDPRGQLLPAQFLSVQYYAVAIDL
ncbi:uncharacterized protein BT62DRAFT_997235 [Guyanagaster necrorhizus]|uniref:Uncharacterized protein n=1 Tax=Guyanagaster necrorhizus TaxID=856835 RepID=A0A9P7VIH2_9AGAR|nr:uncharacterized protein BT62DRAFT_997235 [Guyanagaster necrorhizus MCA 3950]KAG7441309.1 hypothetical protein BT62DRAFT_997235 [Guyanagaster necrorhizus MCA 3950]